ASNDEEYRASRAAPPIASTLPGVTRVLTPALLAASMLIALVPAAAASGPPILAAPGALHSAGVVRLARAPDRGRTSCSARAARERGAVAGFARRLPPVA